MKLPFPLSYPYYAFCYILISFSVVIWLNYAGMLAMEARARKMGSVQRADLGIFTIARQDFTIDSSIRFPVESGKQGILFYDNNEIAKQKKIEPNAETEYHQQGNIDLILNSNIKYYFPRGALTRWLYSSVCMMISAIILLVFRHYSYKRWISAMS